MWRSIFTMLCLECAALAVIGEGRKRELEKYVGSNAYNDCRYLSAEEKDFVRGFLNEGKSVRNERSVYDRPLLQVGDEATIQAYIQKILKTSELDEYVCDSGEPRFIEPLAAILLRQEPFVMSGGDAPTPPRSYSAATWIHQLMIDSPQFSSNVRNWARSLDGDDLPRLKGILSKWWLQNEE